MREIKFRVWDKAHAVMMDWGQYKGKLVAEDFTDDDLMLMQYTGLKDKNGKEIYEGDILRYTFADRTKIDAIVYRLNMFTYKGAIRWDLDLDEVIGNIYDNPELLEVKN